MGQGLTVLSLNEGVAGIAEGQNIDDRELGNGASQEGRPIDKKESSS